MDIPVELIERLQNGNVVLFLGADLPASLTNVPSREDLATALARRLGMVGRTSPWTEIGAHYKTKAGLHALINWLQEQIESTGRHPGSIHRLLAQLPVTMYITTTYDNLLYRALTEMARHPNLPVVGTDDLGLLDDSRPIIVKLFGTRERPMSLVLTADALQKIPQTKAQILAGLVQPALANKTVFVIGQDLSDTHFQSLYQMALSQAGTIRPMAYAVWQGLPEWQKQTWRERGVTVTDAPEMDVLRELLKALGVRPMPPIHQETTIEEPHGKQMPAWNTEAIRQLVSAAFSDGDLTMLCFDHFYSVYEDLSGVMSKGDKIQKLLDYCVRREQVETLLRLVEERNPAQYARFAPRLQVAES